MHLLRKTLLPLLLLSLLGGTALAASVQFPSQGKPALDKNLEYAHNHPMDVLLVEDRPGLRLLAGPSNNAEEIDKVSWWTPKFLDILRVYWKQKDFYLVRYTDPKNPDKGDVWGWINKRLVLDTPCAISEEGSGDPAMLKAIPVMDWRKTEEDKPIYIRKGAGAEFETRGLVNIYAPRWVYKIGTGTDSKKWVLVGESQRINYYAPQNSIQGWVPLDNLIITTNRVGVYYDKSNNRTEPALIFNNKPNAQKWLKTGTYDKDNLVGMEDIAHGQDLSYFDPRFPVLDTNDGKLMQIAFIASTRRVGTGQVMSVSETGKLVEKNIEIVVGTRHKDILFVIDGTVSMSRHFPAVRAGITKYMRGLDSDEKAKYRFGLAVYRDYCDDNDGFHQLVKFSDNYAQFLSALDASNAKRIPCDNDRPEAVMQAVMRAAQKADWNPKHTKLIVLIGDHGNHPGDPKYNEHTAAAVLKEKQIFLYSINVNPRLDPSMNTLFNKQLETTIRKNKKWGKLRVISQADAKATSAEVAVALDESTLLAEQTAAGVVDYIEGANESDLVKRYGTLTTMHILRTILAQGGVTKLRSLRQICEVGWISRYARGSKKQQFRPWFMISKREEDHLTSILGAILDNAINGQANLQGVFQATVEQIVGQRIEDKETLGAFLKRKFGLPYSDLSPVLRYTVEQLERKFMDPTEQEFKIEFIKTLGEKHMKLMMVREEKAYKRLQWNPEHLTWSPIPVDGPDQKRTWFKETSGGHSYAWLPLEMLP